MKRNIIILFVLMICFYASVSYCHAGEFRMVQGLIKYVTDDSIEVNGTYYKISGVPIKNSAEKKVSKDQLKIGRLVEIYFQNNSINSIIVYDENNTGG